MKSLLAVASILIALLANAVDRPAADNPPIIAAPKPVAIKVADADVAKENRALKEEIAANQFDIDVLRRAVKQLSKENDELRGGRVNGEEALADEFEAAHKALDEIGVQLEGLQKQAEGVRLTPAELQKIVDAAIAQQKEK